MLSNLPTNIDTGYFDCHAYLRKYWPKDPKSGEAWQENKWLLEQYVSAAEMIKARSREKWKNLDISTGPTLAPVIPFVHLLEDLQLSDYSEKNREILRDTAINYWSKYAEEVLVMEGKEPTDDVIQKKLNLLNSLRKRHAVVRVDLRDDQMFKPAINTSAFNLFTMHFVADSITDSKDEYYHLLNRVLEIMSEGSIFVMTSLIECTEWDDGVNKYPSPNVKLDDLQDFIGSKGHSILRSSKLMAEDKKGHDGGMAVLVVNI